MKWWCCCFHESAELMDPLVVERKRAGAESKALFAQTIKEHGARLEGIQRAEKEAKLAPFKAAVERQFQADAAANPPSKSGWWR